jgi:hypothetical protein
VSSRQLKSFCHCCVESKEAKIRCMEYWETPAVNLGNVGFSWGSVTTVDCEEWSIWVVSADRGDAGRFIVHADEKLTAFIELQSAIRDASCRT